jgi:phosphoserine phosphatase
MTGAARAFAAVYFDCDSTLSAIEGIDELLARLPAAERDELVVLTRQAMEGSRPLDEVYERRLRALAPPRALLEQVGRLYVARATPDAGAVVAALRWLGKIVGIVSGGLLVPVRMLGEHLGIDPAHVHAVALRFDADGRYLDFDRSSPLWRNGGKTAVLRALPMSHRPCAFVGDGATDLETQGTADLFVGYGGHAVRTVVRDRAERWFATPSLAPLLAFVLTPDERARLAASAEYAPLLPAAGHDAPR